MSPQTQTLLITSGILAAVITVMVLVNTPSIMEVQQQQGKANKTGNLFKVFVMSFGICAFVLYIMQDNDQNAMMTNILKGEPDF